MFDKTSTIRERQNDPSMIALLRAMSVSHARVRRLNSLRLGVASAIGMTGLVASFANWSGIWLAILGAVWGLIYATGLSSWANGELRRAARLQEMFDVRLFGIPWNPVVAGEEIPAYEVSQLNHRYAGDSESLHDYYEIPDLPRPFDVLGCQQQNLGWGARVRRRYANTILILTMIWGGAGLLVGPLAGLDVVGVMLRWYVPSLGIFLLGVDVYIGQRGIANERERVFLLTQRRIAQMSGKLADSNAYAELVIFARQVQDMIFNTRIRHTRVPNWFFSRFQEMDRIDFREAMVELARVVIR